ncbi:cytochrome P450 monooxygenase-like protein [Nemania abortiva]|nr:cytochrome P450 monooxygenase-like protein [Nemania abortiva]
MVSLADAVLQQANAGPVLLWTVLLLVLSTITWKIFYGVCLDPLRSYPGPRIATVTRIPYWIASLRGNQVRWMQSLHKIYGPVVRFGPNDLSYTGAQAWKDIYGHQKGRQENPKDSAFYFPSENGAPSLSVLNLEEHSILRRTIAPAFGDKALKDQEPLFQHCADLMVATVRRLSDEGRPIDMVKIYNLTTFDIMAELVYNESLGLLEASEYTPWVEMVFKSISFLPLIQLLEYYPALKVIFQMLEPKSVQEMRISHHKYSADRLDKRLARGSEKPDIWNLLLAKEEDGPLLTLPQMHSNAELFMAAGTETTATLLSGLTNLLLTSPRCMKALVNEVRSAFDSNDQIDFDSLSKLPYLNACLEEGLRMYPPIPSAFPRVIPEGGNSILGKWIPPGTSVSVHATASYRDPNNFRDPNKFIPERWMGDPAFENDQRDARQPFSLGPRNCLGMGMAWREMRLLLAKIVFNFDLDLCDKSQDWADQNVYILWEKKPLMCHAVSHVGR